MSLCLKMTRSASEPILPSAASDAVHDKDEMYCIPAGFVMRNSFLEVADDNKQSGPAGWSIIVHAPDTSISPAAGPVSTGRQHDAVGPTSRPSLELTKANVALLQPPRVSSDAGTCTPGSSEKDFEETSSVGESVVSRGRHPLNPRSKPYIPRGMQSIEKSKQTMTESPKRQSPEKQSNPKQKTTQRVKALARPSKSKREEARRLAQQLFQVQTYGPQAVQPEDYAMCVKKTKSLTQYTKQVLKKMEDNARCGIAPH